MNTKETILSVALELILANGYNEVSLNQIVSKAGVSKGAFYHYFKSKDELFFEIFNSYFINYLDLFHSIIAAQDITVKKKLSLLSDKIIEIVHVYAKSSSNMGLYLTMFEAMNQFEHLRRAVYEHYNNLEKEIEQMIDYGKLDGSIRADADSGAVSLQILSLIEGLLLMCLVLEVSNVEKKIMTIFETLWNGIKAINL